MMLSLSRLTSHTFKEKITEPEAWAYVISIQAALDARLWPILLKKVEN
jgi:hypothetical protein